MSRLTIAAIVEGHGEVQAVPILLGRIWRELLGGEYVEVVSPPIRRRRARLVTNKVDELANAVNLAVRKLDQAHQEAPQLILVLVDADDDLPCQLGPRLSELVRQARRDKNVSCVVANVEYETWFVAAAESLDRFLTLPEDFQAPQYPEADRCGAGWIEARFNRGVYKKSVDQTKLTARMNLTLCRRRSTSFDKLCRELEKQMARP